MSPNPNSISETSTRSTRAHTKETTLLHTQTPEPSLPEACDLRSLMRQRTGLISVCKQHGNCMTATVGTRELEQYLLSCMLSMKGSGCYCSFLDPPRLVSGALHCKSQGLAFTQIAFCRDLEPGIARSHDHDAAHPAHWHSMHRHGQWHRLCRGREGETANRRSHTTRSAHSGGNLGEVEAPGSSQEGVNLNTGSQQTHSQAMQLPGRAKNNQQASMSEQLCCSEHGQVSTPGTRPHEAATAGRQAPVCKNCRALVVQSRVTNTSPGLANHDKSEMNTL